MFKKSLSILLAVVTLFTLVMPVSAYAEEEEIEPYYYYTSIGVNGKDAFGDYYGSWYYKTWTGEPINPTVKIYDGYDYMEDGECKSATKVLVEGQDYDLSLGNNTDMGCCKLHIKGLGDYSDVNLVKQASYTILDFMTEEEFLSSERENLIYGPIFVIRPLGTKLNKVTPQKKAIKVTWKKQAKKMSVKRITGYQLQVSTNKDFNSDYDDYIKTVNVKGYKNTSKTIKKLKGKKKYYVRVRTYFKCKNGFISYSTWSKAKAVKTK